MSRRIETAESRPNAPLLDQLFDPRVNLAKTDPVERFMKQFAGLSQRGKEDIVGQLVPAATEERFDCASALRAVDIGTRLLLTGQKDFGTRILTGVDQYFGSRPVAYKTLTPPEERSYPEGYRMFGQSEIKPITGRLNTARARGVLSVSLPNVENFIGSLEIVSSAKAGSFNVLILPCVRTLQYRLKQPEIRQVEYQTVKDAYLAIIKTVHEGLRDERTENVMTLAEKIYDIATAHGKGLPRLEFIPDILTTKFAGVSFDDVLTESDLEKAGDKLMIYLANLPKGDIFWQSFIQGILLAPPIHPKKGDLALYKDPDFSENVCMLQEWLGYKLIVPGLSKAEEETDPEFDTNLGEALNRFDQDTISLFVNATVTRTRIALNTVLTFNPDMEHDYNRALQYCPITQLAIDELRSSFPDRKFALYDQVVMSFLKAQKDQILANLIERLDGRAGKRQSKILLSTFSDILDNDQRQDHTLAFLNNLYESVGANFLDRLKTHGEEIVQVSQAVWEDMQKNIDFAYWPHPEAFHQIGFTQGSLPEIMGFEKILFANNSDQDEPVQFMFLTTTGLALIGQIDTLAGKVEFSAELQHESSQLEALIESIVLVTFHDLLVRRKIESARPARREQIIAEGESDIGKETDSNRKAGRPLPRGSTSAESGKLIVSSKDLIEEVNAEAKEKRGFNPRKVDQHKSRLHYAADYQALVDKYLETDPDEKKSLTDILVRAREKVFKPSGEKIANLPTRFQLDFIIDPVTGEKVYIETWVVAHSSPKPTDEEQASPAAMYRKYYRGGSALSYLDYLKSWIFS